MRVDTKAEPDSVERPGGAEHIAHSLAAYWQSIYRCTHGKDNTDRAKVMADYPEHMRLTEPECRVLPTWMA